MTEILISLSNVRVAEEFDIIKRILTLVFGYLKCGSFRNPVKDNAAVDATGMSVPIRLISSEMLEMGLGYYIYGVESCCLFYWVRHLPQPQIAEQVAI